MTDEWGMTCQCKSRRITHDKINDNDQTTVADNVGADQPCAYGISKM
jgi:hypothetical protein